MTMAGGDRRQALQDLIAVESCASPRGFARLAAGLRGAAKEVFDQSVTATFIAQDGAISPYSRRKLAQSAYLYSANTGPVALRHLLVVLPGSGMRPGLPMPAMLQAMDPSKWDVLYLHDPHLSHYRMGITGIADNLSGVAAYIVAMAQGYAGHMIYGVSLGAAAGIALATQTGAARAIALGARMPWDMARLADATVPPADFPLCACRASPVGRTLVVHGAKNHRDLLESRLITAITGARRVAVPDVAQHIVCGHFVAQGQFRRFLDLLINPALHVDTIAERLADPDFVWPERSAA